MIPLAQAVGAPSLWRYRYLSEELARRGFSFLERQDFLGSMGTPPATAEPEVLDAFLDRELQREGA